MSKFPAGALVKITCEVCVPIEATEQEIDDWLRFGFNANGVLPGGNSLARYAPEVFGFEFDWEWDGEIGVEERKEVEPGRYSIRYRRERVEA